MVRKETEPISPPNPWEHGVHSCSKGKAHEARYPFTQENPDRLRRHELVQDMGFDKEGRCGIKRRGIHRRKANQSNPSTLRGTQDYLRFNHDLARITRSRRTETAADVADDRARRFKFGRIKVGHDRPSDIIARIYDERTPGINKRISKRVKINRRVNKSIDNKSILNSTKFQVENFDKEAERIRTAKIARNINPNDEDEPATMQEVINHPTRGKQWEKAIRDKYESLIKNHT